MEIGALLKEAREEQNISLDRLQDTTKIQKRYLKAIEEGNFHILPGTFYARAFIKEYAEAVGLNADKLLAAHQGELPTSQPKSDGQYTRIQRTRRENQASKDPVFLAILPKIIVVLLIIGVLFIAFTLYKKSRESGDTDPENNVNNNQIIIENDEAGNNVSSNDNTNNETENHDDNSENGNNEDANNNDNNDEDENESEASELSLIEEGTGDRPESTFELTNADDDVMLVLEPSGVSWVDIMNEAGDYLYRGNTEPDTPIEIDISGEDRVHLNVGSAPNLPAIYVNDVEFEYPLDPDQYVTQRIWFNISYSNDDE